MADKTDALNGTSAFPTSPSAFDDDERVSYSRADEKYILETAEGGEYEWDSSLRRWIPVLDQSLLEEQSKIYKVEGVDEDEDATAALRSKKRKQPKDENAQKLKKQRVNTAVYVTSIPLDATKDEINHVFNKCGVIAEEIDSGEPRIKMYDDDKGKFKGDALIVYFRPESVKLAVQMMDDSDFRLGTLGPMGKMRVTEADFSYKAQREVPAQNKSSKQDQKKIIQRTQKLNSKLADWDDDDPSVITETTTKWDKVVILKNMFTIQELEEDPAAILEIKEDIREECAKLGEVTNVVLYDKEANGVASIKFRDVEAARECVRVMDGRWFDQRQLAANIATGREKFKKSKAKDLGDESDEEDGEGKRLDKFGSWLEEEKKGS